MLRLESVNAWYGDAQVIHDLDLQLEERGTLAMLGANGAGKTTLLRTITGLIARRSGRVEFKSERIDGLRANQIVERGLVMVPEGRALFPFMTVQENLELGSYSRRARPHRRDSLERVYTLLPKLKERGSQLGGSLSGGEQQMCAIARGLMAKPDLLLLDEPSLGLGPLIVKEVFALIERLKAEGISVLLVEQHVKNALTVTDQGVGLENGRMVMTGASSELLYDAGLRKPHMGQKH